MTFPTPPTQGAILTAEVNPRQLLSWNIRKLNQSFGIEGVASDI